MAGGMSDDDSAAAGAARSTAEVAREGDADDNAPVPTPGARVTLNNLERSVALNGKEGRVTEVLPDGSVCVELMGNGKRLKVRRRNLIFSQPPRDEGGQASQPAAPISEQPRDGGGQGGQASTVQGNAVHVSWQLNTASFGGQQTSALELAVLAAFPRTAASGLGQAFELGAVRRALAAAEARSVTLPPPETTSARRMREVICRLSRLVSARALRIHHIDTDSPAGSSKTVLAAQLGLE